MARYQTREPIYIGGQYIGQFATYNDPVVFEVPDEKEPGIKWEPLDEAAQKALLAMGRKRAAAATEGLDPQKDKVKIDRVTADTMRKYTKEIPVQAAPKVEIREIGTMAEMAQAKGAKVVGRDVNVAGRASDRRPV